jgi:serine phosphatase RsbU (regulator of sigma subunit)
MKRSIRTYWLIILLSVFALGSSGRNLDSLLTKLKSSEVNDTAKAWLLYYISVEYNQKGENIKSRKYIERAQIIADSLKFKRGLARIYIAMAVMKAQAGDYTKAIELQLKALKLNEELGNKTGEATALLNLGNMYFYTEDYERTLECFRKSRGIYESLNELDGAAAVNNNIAAIFVQLKNTDSAQVYFDKVIAYYTKTGKTEDLAQVYLNMGFINQQNKEYKKGYEITLKAHEIYRKTKDKWNMALSFFNMGEFLAQLKDYKRALSYLDSSRMVAIETGSRDQEARAWQGLAAVYDETGKHEEALRHMERFVALNDSLLSEENSRNIAEMQTRFETEKKEREIELLSKNKSIRDLQMAEQETNLKRQAYLIYSLIGGFIILSILLFLVLRSYNQKKRINNALEKINFQILSQKKQIEEKNNLIADSIEYARDIQTAVLPGEETLKKTLGDYFVIYNPKDVVSGDFYWVKRVGEKIYFAVVDCTGHGVPGAFMSVMALNLLENILQEHRHLSNAEVLDELNRHLAETLGKGSKRNISKFGMDIALCSLAPGENKDEQWLDFAGAHHPVFIVHKGILEEIKGDQIFPGMTNEKFSTHKLPVHKDDMIYLFTDGATDQFGGDKREKLFSFRFKEWISSLGEIPPSTQQTILLEKMTKWKGAEEQLDDILVMGVKVG